MQKRLRFSKSIKVAILLLALFAGANAALAVWVAPTTAPTTQNVAPPINTSSTIQSKAGGLTDRSFLGAPMIWTRDDIFSGTSALTHSYFYTTNEAGPSTDYNLGLPAIKDQKGARAGSVRGDYFCLPNAKGGCIGDWSQVASAVFNLTVKGTIDCDQPCPLNQGAIVSGVKSINFEQFLPSNGIPPKEVVDNGNGSVTVYIPPYGSSASPSLDVIDQRTPYTSVVASNLLHLRFPTSLVTPGPGANRATIIPGINVITPCGDNGCGMNPGINVTKVNTIEFDNFSNAVNNGNGKVTITANSSTSGGVLPIGNKYSTLYQTLGGANSSLHWASSNVLTNDTTAVTVNGTKSNGDTLFLNNSGSNNYVSILANKDALNFWTAGTTHNADIIARNVTAKADVYDINLPTNTSNSQSHVCVDASGKLILCAPIVNKPECSDGIDNDGDGLIDAADPGCHVGGDLSKAYIPTKNDETDPNIIPEKSDTCTPGLYTGASGTGTCSFTLPLDQNITGDIKIELWGGGGGGGSGEGAGGGGVGANGGSSSRANILTVHVGGTSIDATHVQPGDYIHVTVGGGGKGGGAWNHDGNPGLTTTVKAGTTLAPQAGDVTLGSAAGGCKGLRAYGGGTNTCTPIDAGSGSGAGGGDTGGGGGGGGGFNTQLGENGYIPNLNATGLHGCGSPYNPNDTNCKQSSSAPVTAAGNYLSSLATWLDSNICSFGGPKGGNGGDGADYGSENGGGGFCGGGGGGGGGMSTNNAGGLGGDGGAGHVRIYYNEVQ